MLREIITCRLPPAPQIYEPGTTTWVAVRLVREAMRQLTEEQQDTLWLWAMTDTQQQAAELAGIARPPMQRRWVRASAAFLAVFDLDQAVQVGIVR